MSKAKIIGLVVAFFVAIAVLSGAGWAWRYYTADTRGAVEAEERIESASSQISNYEFFFDLCTSVKRKESRIEQQERLLEQATSEEESRRIRRNLASLKSARDEDIARYNSNASKEYTRARFQSSTLPARLDPTDESTTCNTETEGVN